MEKLEVLKRESKIKYNTSKPTNKFHFDISSWYIYLLWFIFVVINGTCFVGINLMNCIRNLSGNFMDNFTIFIYHSTVFKPRIMKGLYNLNTLFRISWKEFLSGPVSLNHIILYLFRKLTYD